MSTTVLNEHDANQGAQSQGEFLGMTGNSGWYLLGAAGVTVMMVILLWGVLGISLLFCVMMGLVLCLLAVAYVFTLKNNKPDHYDTDFFESLLVGSGVVELSFGPRAGRPPNPFAEMAGVSDVEAAPVSGRARGVAATTRSERSRIAAAPFATSMLGPSVEPQLREKLRPEPAESTVPSGVVSELQAELALRDEQLEEALAEREED